MTNWKTAFNNAMDLEDPKTLLFYGIPGETKEQKLLWLVNQNETVQVGQELAREAIGLVIGESLHPLQSLARGVVLDHGGKRIWIRGATQGMYAGRGLIVPESNPGDYPTSHPFVEHLPRRRRPIVYRH